MEIKLCVNDGEQISEIRAEELARRLLSHFPSAVIDGERGDAYVQAGLDRLIGLGAPSVILDSHRVYFGNVIFVSVSEAHWEGATATSYLHRIWPPLGDIVFFNVDGAKGVAAVSIANELGAALDMSPHLEVVAEGS